MPQMAPMNWLMLFIFFTMIFMSFNFMNYFITIHNNNKMMKFNKQKKNWKW